MPVCSGRPEAPCPEKRNDSSVQLLQGDLMLCPACDAYRFPPKNSNSTALKSGTSMQLQTADTGNVSNSVDKGRNSVPEKISDLVNTVTKPVAVCLDVIMTLVASH